MQERTTDRRSYIEVTREEMERKSSQVRHSRDGDRSRDIRDSRGAFQGFDHDARVRRGISYAHDSEFRDMRGDYNGFDLVVERASRTIKGERRGANVISRRIVILGSIGHLIVTGSRGSFRGARELMIALRNEM